MKRALTLLAFVTLVPPSLLAQDLQIPIPSGWVDITAKVARNDTGGISTALVAQTKNPLCKLLIADPKTLNDTYPVYLAAIQMPYEGNVPEGDEGFKEMAKSFEESVKKKPDITLLGDKTVTYGKRPVFRAEIKMPLKIGQGAPLIIHAVQYLIPHGGKAMLLVGYAPHSKWIIYKTVFDNLVAKMLE